MTETRQPSSSAPSPLESIRNHQPDSLVSTLLATRGNVQASKARLETAAAHADEFEPWLKAFTHRASFDQTRMDADAARLADTPLAGSPVAIKDLMDTADMPTRYGSAIHAGHQPAADAWIVERIRAYGGVVLGKTVTTEFAWRHPGPTVNPWNPLHTPGGSSSGSAAAVGAGIVPLATGTQTVGSVIRPAAYCGVVGYKPSYGKISTRGVHPLADTLDHISFFVRKVEDAALSHALFIDAQPEAIASTEAWRRYFCKARDLPAPSLAVVRTPLWDSVSEAQKSNFEACLDRLKKAGAMLTEHSFDDMPVVLAAIQTLLAVEANIAIGPTARAHPGSISPPMTELIEQGAAVADADYRGALALRERLRGGFRAFLSNCDAIVTIPANGAAPLGLTATGDASFCAPWSFLGVPALTMPSGFTAAGLPLGLQIVGELDADLPMLRTAAWVEHNLG